VAGASDFLLEIVGSAESDNLSRLETGAGITHSISFCAHLMHELERLRSSNSHRLFKT
jgi:hypothetical protein